MAVFILAVIVNSYTTGQVGRFSSPSAGRSPPAGGVQCWGRCGWMVWGEHTSTEEKLHLSPALCSSFSGLYLPFFLTSECSPPLLYK